MSVGCAVCGATDLPIIGHADVCGRKSKRRPSEAIYCREDKAQMWRECESAYELGYIAGEADMDAGLAPLTEEQHSNLWGATSDYAEGYGDACADAGALT